MKEQYDFSLEACYQSVMFAVNTLKKNPFELLGRYIIGAEQDPYFNETMIEAIKRYLLINDVKWNDKV